MTESVIDNKEYWNKRAKGYSEVNKEELLGVQRKNWSQFLTEQIDVHFANRDRSTISILDVGAGPGFISIILSEAGYKVTAFDFSHAMLDEARNNAGCFSPKIEFVQGDAERLPFAKESFDVIFSRNLTWNLSHPDKAYRVWTSTLKKGGLLLVFDANWYAYLLDDEKLKAYNKDRENVKRSSFEDYNIGENFDQMEKIAYNMPLTKCKRPGWDVDFLNRLEIGHVESIEDIGKRLYSEKELVNYNSTPLFMVKLEKNEDCI